MNAARQLDEEDETLTEAERKRILNLERLRIQAEVEELAVTLDDLHFKEEDEKKDSKEKKRKQKKPTAQEEQWQVQRQERKRRFNRLRRGLNSKHAMTPEEVNKVVDVWSLGPDDRWKLYRYWLNQYKERLRQEIKEKEAEYQRLADRSIEIGQELDMTIMQDATIIGMTTTGAARYRGVLQRIAPRIVIVEEAAEVLEAHIITSISMGCEHLILIGDHQQLRPSPAVYELAKKYRLDISLFERMIKNGMGVVTLAKQHRMKPLISSLLQPIYPKLEDADSVKDFEHILGISKDLYFIDHNRKESQDDELKSKANAHEAEYVTALCRYLILQGYSPTQITVLTMYSGQLMLLKNNMPKKFFGGVRVTSVDNFQGEENDIIILSLVRSNNEGKIGFVGIDNRICVSLSRAKKGLYCIGNFSLLCQKSPMWKDIVEIVDELGCRGPTLSLYCQNHPRQAVEAGTAKDFKHAPEGGCLRPCGTRLNCGHACPRACHAYDREHRNVKCTKTCQKILCDKGHRCPLKCFQDCGDCQTPVRKKMPNCGHTQTMACHKEPATFSCRAECRHILECGHRCSQKCGQPHTTRCLVRVPFTWPCQHEDMIECYRTRSPPPCPKPCNTLLACEHECKGQCGLCFQGRLHQACRSKCGRTLVCGHPCQEPCTKSCPPCRRQCETRCIHSKCPRKCGEPCEPCKEPCIWRCEHFQCTRLCSEPCDRPPCDQPCQKLIATCGHPCIGLCGEPCPDKCIVCHREEVTQILFGNEDDENAVFVQLEDCKHVIESSALDKYMKMTEEHKGIQLKGCPLCKTTIRRNLRYGTIINETLNDIEMIKSRSFGIASEIKQRKGQLLRMIGAEIEEVDPESTRELEERLTKKHHTPENLCLIENQIHSLKHLGQMSKKLRKEKRTLIKEGLGKQLEKLEQQIELMKGWLLKHDVRIADQVIHAQ